VCVCVCVCVFRMILTYVYKVLTSCFIWVGIVSSESDEFTFVN